MDVFSKSRRDKCSIQNLLLGCEGKKLLFNNIGDKLENL